METLNTSTENAIENVVKSLDPDRENSVDPDRKPMTDDITYNSTISRHV